MTTDLTKIDDITLAIYYVNAYATFTGCRGHKKAELNQELVCGY